nr:hypothetical protein [Capnocytophaga canimorsus]
MGFVFKQSLKNILTTYLGFAIGAINTLFLFTYFLSKSQYGLVSYITSTATIFISPNRLWRASDLHSLLCHL